MRDGLKLGTDVDPTLAEGFHAVLSNDSLLDRKKVDVFAFCGVRESKLRPHCPFSRDSRHVTMSDFNLLEVFFSMVGFWNQAALKCRVQERKLSCKRDPEIYAPN
jgi:hypothetical protein